MALVWMDRAHTGGDRENDGLETGVMFGGLRPRYFNVGNKRGRRGGVRCTRTAAVSYRSSRTRACWTPSIGCTTPCVRAPLPPAPSHRPSLTAYRALTTRPAVGAGGAQNHGGAGVSGLLHGGKPSHFDIAFCWTPLFFLTTCTESALACSHNKVDIIQTAVPLCF